MTEGSKLAGISPHLQGRDLCPHKYYPQRHCLTFLFQCHAQDLHWLHCTSCHLSSHRYHSDCLKYNCQSEQLWSFENLTLPATKSGGLLGHFRDVSSLCFKARLSAKPLIRFLLKQIKFILFAHSLVLKVRVLELRNNK